MAGAGYKLFNTGDVLTAAQVNTYLMEQTVMRFATTTARDTALSGVLAEGMICYIDADNNLYKYTGSAWVNIDSTGGGSPLTTKGDLYTYSTTDARLAVGNNGETLVADSSTSTGLRWQPSYQAGKNFIINGGFDIWQRGTSFTTVNTGNGYNADRWTYYGGGTGTITRSTALLRDGAQFALRFTSTSAAGNADIYQLIETLNTVQLQGKTVTVSVYVAGTAGKTAQVLLGSSTTDDDGLFGSYTILTPSGTSSVTTTGSYQRITAQYTIPSNARTLRLGLNHGALANTEFMSWAQVMLEVGSTATNFSRAGGNIAGELSACQRYYEQSYDAGTAPGSNTSIGLWMGPLATVSGSGNFTTVSYKVVKRTAPTVTVYTPSGTSGSWTAFNSGGGQTGRTFTGSGAGTQGFAGYLNSATELYAQGHWTASAEL